MKKVLSNVSVFVLSLALTVLVLVPNMKTAEALPAPGDYTYTSLLDDLAGYWPFDDNMWDYPSNGNLANTSTAYYNADNIKGRSLFFDPLLSSVVTLPDDPSLNNLDDELAISVWFKLPNGEASDYALVAQRDGFGDNFELFANKGGELAFSVWDRFNTEYELTYDAPIIAGQWHHVLVNVKAGEYMRMYFDNVLGADETAVVPAQISNDMTETYLGDNFFANYLDGYMDEVALWKRVLTDDERNFLFNDGSGNSLPVVRNYLTWNFEDTYKKSKISPPTDLINNYYPDNGHGFLSMNGSQEFYSWGLGSGGTGTNAPIVRTWADGADANYYRVSLNAEGITDLKVSSKQRGSNTGPRDFKLQYSTSGRMPLVWTDVPGGAITVADNFTTGVLSDLDLPDECDESSVLYLRWLMTSNTSVSGAVVSDAGTNRIDDIVITGTKVNWEPEITSLSPASVLINSADTTIEVIGRQFIPTSVVGLGGRDLVTTYVSSTKLLAVIPAGNLTVVGDSYSIQVSTPAPGGGLSNVSPFTVENPVPTLTTMLPDNSVMGALGFTMTLTGSEFMNPDSVVRFNGSDKVTRYIDANTLESDIPASDLLASGVFNVTVFNALPGGGESAPLAFTIVDPVPSISSISPVSKVQNSGTFTLTVYGSGFVAGSVVRYNGVDKVTTYVDSTTLTASIPALDVSVIGTFNVDVFTPAPGGGLSGVENFTVSAPAPVSSGGGGGGVVLLPVQLANVYDISDLEINITDALELKNENLDIRFSGLVDPNQYIISEDENFKGAKWQSYSDFVQYRISSEIGRKTLYFKFRNTSNSSSELVLKNINLLENGGEILHGSADDVEFSQLSMNERVRSNLERLRAKKLLEEKQRSTFVDIDIPYEVMKVDGVHSSAEDNTFAFVRYLNLGMRGDDVENLQKILEVLGYYKYEEGPTGYYGEVTKLAVIDFQRDNGLAPFPGSLGPKTISLLNNEYLYLLK